MNHTPNKPIVAIYHDIRRPKKDKTCPVKLRVTYGRERTYFPLGIELTPHEFEQTYLVPTPKREYRENRAKLNAAIVKAEDIIREMIYFSFEQLREKFYGPVVKKESFLDFGNAHIENMRKEENQIKTAINYGCALVSLKKYFLTKYPKRSDILFQDISVGLLNGYEKWMVEEKGKSLNTVGMYMRGVRAIINSAIENKLFPREFYPFGEKGYVIPSVRKIKRSINKNDLSKLFNFDAKGDYSYERALDFWFLSYQCYGINFRDIACLRYSKITPTSIVFYRHKTKRKKKNNLKPIIVPRTEFVNYVLKRYGKQNPSKNDYVFSIIKEGMSEEEIIRHSDNFIRSVNQYMKKVAKEVGVTEGISTYWARHSFTTNVIRDGESIEYASECLGHASVKTTQNYWDGFEDTVKREVADKLMDFKNSKPKTE